MAKDEWGRQFHKQIEKIHQTLADLQDSQTWNLGNDVVYKDEWDANGWCRPHRWYNDKCDGFDWNKSWVWITIHVDVDEQIQIYRQCTLLI